MLSLSTDFFCFESISLVPYARFVPILTSHGCLELITSQILVTLPPPSEEENPVKYSKRLFILY